MSARYCYRCGAERVEDASFCHKCGASYTGATTGSFARDKKDHFKTGLLLIKIGAILAVVLPLLSLAGISVFTGGAFLSSIPVGMSAGTLALGILAFIIGFGVVLGAIAFKFHQDIAGGNHDRIVHALILAAVMFFLGSNVAGIIVGIGAFLCYTSPRRKA